MQESVCSVLCAAIVSNSGQSRKLAFELIRQWVETVIVLENGTNISAKMLTQTFIQFLVKLGQTIDTWCHDMAQRGYRSPTSYEIYTYKLAQWHEEGNTRKRAIGVFMQEVLRQCKIQSVS